MYFNKKTVVTIEKYFNVTTNEGRSGTQVNQ